MNKKIFIVLLVNLLVAVIGGIAGVSIYKRIEAPKGLFKEFYDTENAVAISPSALRKYIDNQDKNYVLVDLRSSGEYNLEHIVGAINIPASSLDEKSVVSEFRKLPQDKQIIMYCYSAYCMLARQVGQVLSNEGIKAKDLNIGWSEWKYYWGIWNPGEDPKVGLKYLEIGTKTNPNTNINTTPDKCTTNSKFGC